MVNILRGWTNRMASIKFEKTDKEWLLFTEFWKLCQKYWVPENDDSYWDDVIDDTTKFINKYNDCKLAEHIGIAFINYLDSIYKENKK